MRSRLPDIGPIICSIPEITGRLIVGAQTVTVFFIWPSSYMVTGLFCRAMTTGLSSNMFLAIQDDARNALILNGFGLNEANVVALQPNAMPQDVAGGTPAANRWIPLQRYVHQGDKWRFVLRTLATVRPELLFRLESPLWQDAPKLRGAP